jgi:hypothetical protein
VKRTNGLAYFPGCGPWGREKTIQPLELDDPLPSFGYRRGETIYADSAEHLKLDDAAVLDTPEGICVGRVLYIDRHGVTLRVECGEDCYHPWSEVEWAGRIRETTTLKRPKRRLNPATEAAPTDSPAQVIDLNVYRQAHPQRIRNLLFAEKQ